MSQDKRHPKTVYDAKYPYNRMETTESGHEIHYDDTPGKERIRESHKSGTYKEISHDGKHVHMVVGNRVDYTKQGKTTTIDKNHDEKIGGSSRVSIHGGSHSEVKGNQTTAVDGDHKTMVGKDMVSAVKGDMATGVKGKTTFKMGGDLKIKGDALVHTIMDGVAKHEYGAEVTTTAESDMKDESKTKITHKVGGSSVVIDGSSIVLTVGGSSIRIEDGKITLDAAIVLVTKGGQQVSPTSNMFTG